MSVFETTVRRRSTLYAEFEKLEYQLYDVLAEQTGSPPERDDFYLELESVGDAEVYLLCEDPGVVDGAMVDRIKATLSAGGYELNWSVRVSIQEGGRPVFDIFRDGVVRLS